MKKYIYQPLTFVAPVRAICGNPKIIALMVLCIIIVTNTMAQERATKEHRHLIKQHCYADYKQMYKQPEGGALIYPYITPGSRQYARVLWDWDSWLSDVALRQILADTGTDADRREALTYEQGCVLNYLAYTSLEDGYMPMVVDAESDPAKMKPKDIYSTNMHKPVIAQHAAFITQQNGGDATWLRESFSRIQAFIRNYQEHHHHEGTGLFYWQDDLAIGVDNDPSTFFRPKGSSASIYLNCLMYELSDVQGTASDGIFGKTTEPHRGCKPIQQRRHGTY